MVERPIATDFLRPFAAHLRALGVDPVPLAVRAGVLARRGDRPEPIVRHGVVRAFCELAAEAAGDPLLGVHVAKSRPRGSLGVVELGMRACDDVHGALGFFVRFSPLLRDATVSWAEADRRELRVGFSVPGDAAGLGRQGHAYKVAALAALVAELTDGEARLARAWFSDAASRVDDELRAATAPELQFGRGDSGVALASDRLGARVRTADAPLFAYLERQAAEQLAGMRDAVVPTYIRERLRALLRAGEPGLEGLARSLRMSPRTLQRRFHDAGSSYHAFLDETRREIALRELEQTDVGVEALAAHLGFSSAGTFIRAFRRWTGTTPTAHRRRITGI